MIHKNLTMIVAISQNNIIGQNTKNPDGTNNYTIPWDFIREDMKQFRDLTINNSVIMGRKTYDSLPDKFKPLPNRKNIVMTRKGNLSAEGLYLARTIDEALEHSTEGNPIVMGGHEIYKMFLPLANKLEITKIHKNVQGNVAFPEVNWNEWTRTRLDEREGFSFETYIRKT